MKLKIGDRIQAIPDGEYLAVVESIQIVTMFKRTTLDMRFCIKDSPYNGVILRGYININYKSFSVHTKFFKMVQAISKDELETGDEIDTDIFLNKLLRVRTKKNISNKTKNEFSNVVEILGVEIEEL